MAGSRFSLNRTLLLGAGVAGGILVGAPHGAPLWHTLLAGFLGGIVALIIITVLRRLLTSAPGQTTDKDNAADQ